MKRVPLTQGYFALVDDGDYARVARYNWCAQVTPRAVYAHHGVKRNGKWTTEKMHAFILGVAASSIDHEDHDGLNNQRHNLRPASRKQNGGNRRKQSTPASSVFKGVIWIGYKWRARIRINNKLIDLGVFTDEAEAALAYDAAALKHFGEFAHVNFSIGGELHVRNQLLN